jgi:hypothetical protein
MPPPQPPHPHGPPRQMRHDFPGQQPPLGMPPHLHHRPPQPFQGPPQSHMQNGPGPGLVGGLRVNYDPPNGFALENLASSHAGHPRPTPGAPLGYTPYPMGPGGGRPHDAMPTQGPAAGQAATTVPTPTTNFTNEQIDQAWKEYTSPFGVNYYHNTATGESTYTKPNVLAKQAAAATPPPTVSSKRSWHEYEDAASGKTYYSDGVTTTWEKPAGFKSETEKTKVKEVQPEPQAKKKKAGPKIETVFNNREEAIAAFKGLLLAKGLAPTLKWHEVVKLCSSDSRWEACEDALTVGERRQALAEYQTKRANELRTLERQERIRAKEAFGKLLTETLPLVPSFSAWSSNFSDVRTALSKDDRFYAVEEEGTRESLFLDFCEEFRKREERKKRSKKRDAHDALLSFFKEREEGGSLSFASTWYAAMTSF